MVSAPAQSFLQEMELLDGVEGGGGGGIYSAFDENDDNTTMSSDSSKPLKLQLPVSCDPPGPSNPPKQLVWIVSAHGYSSVTPFFQFVFGLRRCVFMNLSY
jgi:hypothetical protein